MCLIPLPSGISVNAPRLLFYDQNRAGSQLNDSVSATSEHSLAQRRMAGSPDHQEISTEFTGEIDDASHGVTDKHMGLQPHILFRCHCFGASAHSCNDDRLRAARFRPRRSIPENDTTSSTDAICNSDSFCLARSSASASALKAGRNHRSRSRSF
jgi:hypothetical protein